MSLLLNRSTLHHSFGSTVMQLNNIGEISCTNLKLHCILWPLLQRPCNEQNRVGFNREFLTNGAANASKGGHVPWLTGNAQLGSHDWDFSVLQKTSPPWMQISLGLISYLGCAWVSMHACHDYLHELVFVMCWCVFQRSALLVSISVLNLWGDWLRFWMIVNAHFS